MNLVLLLDSLQSSSIANMTHTISAKDRQMDVYSAYVAYQSKKGDLQLHYCPELVVP